MRTGTRKTLTALLCLCMSMPLLTALPTSVDGLETQVILSEDFDDEWPGDWIIGDANDASGLDYWGTTRYEVESGYRSAYCAAYGENTLYEGAPNVDITGLDSSFWPHHPQDYVLRYDTKMDAYMRHDVAGGNGFSTLTLTFQYWSETGNSTTEIGEDYLWIAASASDADHPGERAYTEVWRQPVSSSPQWRFATVALPEGTTWISINFHSGPNVPEGGPYIGAFVDDVEVEGSVEITLSSFITNLPASTNQSSFPVSASVTGDVDERTKVEIHYRVDGTGNFKLYSTPSNPLGRWPLGPITFQAQGSGHYELFSRAYNSLWDQEPMKSVADATILVDATSPNAVHSLSGTMTDTGWYSSPVSVHLNATDDYSGVLSIKYRWDGGQWKEYRGPLTMDADGDHTLQYYAIDNLGNAQSVRTVDDVNLDRLGPTVTFGVPQGNQFEHDDVVIGFELTDLASGIGSINYSVDGGPFAPLPVNAREISLTGLQNGSHTFVVLVRDGAGNPSQTLLQFKVGGMSGGESVAGWSLTVAMLAVLAFPVAGAVLWLSRRRS